ncbi:hypothetical protein EYZ11_011080 [Aspergillus tanneri]|uniref:Uncharacterized protein n=1 Tax=Aspergillus tanneri TaxID=1220188 RepID=A0A4S3J3Q2_9EURO|nr:hypothetical protein EYZ11_011080 [Aspergillus tanneri]
MFESLNQFYVLMQLVI